MRRQELPGTAPPVLVGGIRPDDRPAVFEAMLDGWASQQRSRQLRSTTINPRLSLVRQFRSFTDAYPWAWRPGDLENFTSSPSAPERSPSTLRGHRNTVGLFCDYLVDERYGWTQFCTQRYGDAPTRLRSERNTPAGLGETEDGPDRRPMSRHELQAFFDHADGRVQRTVDGGRKGAMAALRDTMMFKVMYAYGLRRGEVVRLDVPDLRPNPRVPQWGRYGSLHVRHAGPAGGGPTGERIVLSLPEFDWAVEGLRQWVELARPRMRGEAYPALWLTERASRVTGSYLDRRFAELRDELGFAKDLVPACLRQSYIAHLIDFGYPEPFVRAQAGHAISSATAAAAPAGDGFRNAVPARTSYRAGAHREGGP